MSFAEQLRALMAERGISGQQLARRVPCHPSLVTHYRTGRKRPSPKMAKLFDAALGAGGELAALGPGPPEIRTSRASAPPPTGVALDPVSVWEWPEQRLCHNQANVYTALPDVPKARQAQQRARQLYPPRLRRSVAQIELSEAACMVIEGFAAEGIEHARGALASLPDGQRTLIVRHMTGQVYDALPAAARALPAASQGATRDHHALT